MVTHFRRGGRAAIALVPFLCLATASAQELTTPSAPPPGPTAPMETAPSPYPPTSDPIPLETPPASATSPIQWGARLLSSWVSENHSTTVFLTPQAQLDYRIVDNWHLGTTWALSWLLDNQGLSASLLKLGNPLLEGTYRYSDETNRLAVSLGLTAPLVTVPLGPEGRLHAFMVNQNLAMTGMWNAWLWLRDYLAIPLQAHFERSFQARHSWRIGAALIPLFGIRSESSSKDFMAQGSVALRLALTPIYDLAPRLQGVLLPSSGLERWQMAVGMRLDRHTTSRYFLDLLLNLGKPNGVGGGMERFGLAIGREFDL